MRSYLWQWFVFSLICFNYGRSDGKPILSNLIQRVGQGLQKAVRSFRGAPPVNSSTVSTNILINKEDSVSSKPESDSELKKLSDEELMAELRKMADSDPEGTMGAKETLNDIEMSISSGKSLSQAINSTIKKVNSNPKQLKCLFSRKSLLGRGAQVVGDSDTEIRNTSLLSNSPLARWLRLFYRRKPGPVSEYIEKTESQITPITPIIKPTAQKIVQEYVVDEKGVPTHLIINGQPTPLTTIAERLSIGNPEVPVINSSRKVSEPPVDTMVSATSRPILPPSPPVTTGTDTVLPLNPTPVSVSRDVITPPTQPPQITTNNHQQVSVGQPPNLPRSSISTSEISVPPSSISTSEISVPPSSISTSETNVPSNPPTPTNAEFVTFLPPPTISSQTRSTTLRPPDIPPTTPLPNQISTIFSEANRPRTGRPQPPTTEVEESRVVIPSRITQPQPDIGPLQSSRSLLLVPEAIFQRDGEPPQRVRVYFDRERNAFLPVPDQN